MSKRIIAIFLSAIFIFSCIPTIMAAEEPACLDPTDGLIPKYSLLTRGPFIYALWRFCDSPEPTIENPYTDIHKNDFYYKAVLWAVENRIASGVSGTTFEPNSTILRAHVVSFLYNALADKNAQIPENPFTDVSESRFFYKSALWAYNEGYISARNEPTLFAPAEVCYYGQIYWDKSAPAVDALEWGGNIIRCNPLSDNLEFSFDETTGTLTISGTGKMREFNEPYSYHTENGWIAPWSAYREQVISVVIEDGITTVGSTMFVDFPNLKSVSLPDSITRISNYAFNWCDSLLSINLPVGLESIGTDAFYCCTNLTGIVIPDSVYKIDSTAFAACEKIEEVNIPTGITTIEYGTFGGCKNLSRVYIPATVTSINRSAFDSCSSLTDVYYGGTAGQWEQVDVIYEYANEIGIIEYCNQAMKKANIHYLAEEPETGTCGEDAKWVLQSNGVLTISGTGSMYDYVTSTPTAIQPTAEAAVAPWSEFRNRINTVLIQEGITHIGSNAFSDCPNLNSAILPNSVTSAGDSAFSGCDKLTNIYYGGTQENWDTLFDDTIPDNSKVYVDMPDNPFRDVKPADFYCGSVLWAVEKGITSGTSDTTFSPAASCNRAQAVTFLWAAAGKPEPTITEHSFVDVPKGSFCEKAVLWAVEKGITTGTDETHFSPLATCNRATIVTFLYKAFHSPEVSAVENPFEDVPDESWYTVPALWAKENGITSGTDATHFSPASICNRAQIVTFLYGAYN